ncbi:MAG: cyclic nucleotide-binding domain-containing protein [Acidobacteriota bacterium]
MDNHPTELFWALGILAGVVITAALVNRLRPQHRSRLRRLVTLFVLFAITLIAGVGFEQASEPAWASGLFTASEVLRAFALVNIAATLAFSVFLPAAGVVLPMIASDLLVGVGYAVTTIGVLSHHGVNPNSALVSGAVVSGVLAISLQSTLGNILGGVALQLDGSIHEGDWVQLENGKQGKVQAIRWRHTVIETRDWSTIIVPNAQLLANNIMILGKRGGEHVPQRMWVWFNVDFRFPPTRVIQVVSDAVLDAPIENIADEPPPNCVCMDFSHEGRESFASYAVRYWIKDLAPDDPTNSRVRARIYTALRRAGIPLAVPAHTAFVEMHDEVRAQKRTAREIDERLAALQTVHLFRGFKPDELRTLAAGMSHVLYAANERITKQGAVAHWLYVMTSGQAEIRINENGAPPRTVAKLQAPDFFGEMGLMTGEPRIADVVALGHVDCFRLGKDTFEQVLLGRPDIVGELSEKLATRRVELIAVREGLDAKGKQARQAKERERIVDGIRAFFGL